MRLLGSRTCVQIAGAKTGEGLHDTYVGVALPRREAVFACLALGFASTSAHAAVKEARIGVQFGLVYLPVAVAQAQGFFTAEANKAGVTNFNVAITRFSGSTAISDAFLSGNIDIGAWGVPALLIMWDLTKGRYDVHALAAHPFILETK
jgi:NitT/TauT family transport system substrate-binding protein